MIGISVIICCYNSKDRIPETIHHIAIQEVNPNISWEVIIVNNNSNDNTDEIAQTEWLKYNCLASFTIINELNPGQSHARKTGIYAAKYCYSIFCDDDNWLSPDYLQIAFDIMESNNQIGMLGGQGIAVCEINPPVWFENKKNGFAVGLQGTKSGDLTERGYLWGAGVVLRTNVLQEIYNSNFKSLLTGRKGEKLMAGDDSEISAWFRLAKYKLWYDERLKYQHFIPAERLTEEYVKKIWEGFNLASLTITPYYRIIHFRSLNTIGKTKLLSKAFMKIILRFIYPVRFKLQYSENLSYLQIFLGSVVIFDSELASVQNMLKKPLRILMSINK
ncbi:MAG: glycosyltransferase [Mariniphaga sp.]